ncbi:hypothetical protein BC828DRAFT_385683 [Blastocladiella britannica]|nr:hypothetical protein BC828DRAFT_385683 [Blastocladiella britannica]
MSATLTALTSTEDIALEFDDFVKRDLKIALNYGPGEKVCRTWLRNNFCPLGVRCPNKHPRTTGGVVCKHWLRALCQKGDACEYLHEYNMRKMPECRFYKEKGTCPNAECEFRHIDAHSKIRECAWFARGFCKHGSHCLRKHVKKSACLLYLAGFCPYGKTCTNGQCVHVNF